MEPTNPSTLILPAAPVAFCGAALPVAVPPVAVPQVAVLLAAMLPVGVLVLPVPPIAFCCPAVTTTGRNAPSRSLASSVATCRPSDRVLTLGPAVLAGADAESDRVAPMLIRVSLSAGRLEEAVQTARVVPVS